MRTAIGTSADERDRILRIGYQEHVPDLFTYVCRLVRGDWHRAEDIVQETLLRCWSNYGDRDSQSLRPWLFRVAHNLIIDEHRKAEARPRELGRVALEETAVENDQIDQTLTSVVVAEAFKSLTPAHREVLYETQILGRTVFEAAKVLGIAVGTAKSRVFYALRALKLALYARGVGAEQNVSAVLAAPQAACDQAA
nr:sigma-70 family RNA polymerase sigma factor [Kibdelosporangium sp. MJ126-NF4]